ncbi:hypothetical protein [Methanosphaerula subterraneus]|uniref:hypothetical protein n=1 Tax=Methanosphaerula subterraneus TaxID=3350244 RepID=UPI003F853666
MPAPMSPLFDSAGFTGSTGSAAGSEVVAGSGSGTRTGSEIGGMTDVDAGTDSGSCTGTGSGAGVMVRGVGAGSGAVGMGDASGSTSAPCSGAPQVVQKSPPGSFTFPQAGHAVGTGVSGSSDPFSSDITVSEVGATGRSTPGMGDGAGFIAGVAAGRVGTSADTGAATGSGAVGTAGATGAVLARSRRLSLQNGHILQSSLTLRPQCGHSFV